MYEPGVLPWLRAMVMQLKSSGPPTRLHLSRAVLAAMTAGFEHWMATAKDQR